jgi:hypothetical protein
MRKKLDEFVKEHLQSQSSVTKSVEKSDTSITKSTQAIHVEQLQANRERGSSLHSNI